MPKLIICPMGDPSYYICKDCICVVPHYEDACLGKRCLLAPNCQLIDEEQRLEAEEEYKEHCTGWNGLSAELMKRWADESLNGAGVSVFKKFIEIKPLGEHHPGKTIKFRRYGEFKADP